MIPTIWSLLELHMVMSEDILQGWCAKQRAGNWGVCRGAFLNEEYAALTKQ